MIEFNETKFYKLLQDFFINNNKETFIQFLAEFYNKTEGIIIKNGVQDEIIKELREMFIKFNEKGIDENIIREKVNYFIENNEKIQDIITKLNINVNNIENVSSQVNDITHSKDYSNNSVLPIYDEPIISFVIDDGSNAYVDMFQSVFEENNIKPTLAIVTDWIGTNGHFTLNQLKEYKKKGYEIVGHSATHSTDIYKNNGTEETITSDLERCYNFIKQNGFNSNVIVYPFGNFTNSNFYKNIARKFFNIGINAVAPNIVNNNVPDTMYLERQFINKSVYSLDQIKEKIDYVKNNKGWLILGLHTNETECDTQFLRNIVNYIMLSGIKVKNITDGFKIKGNRISIGEYDDVRSVYINAKGEMKNGFNIVRWSESQNYGVDRTPNGYQNGITLLNIHAKNNNGIPCTLLNFKGDNGDFYFQMKKDYNSNQLYLRYWDNERSLWSNFNKIGFSDVETFNIINVNGYTNETRTVVKKINKILHCNISLVNSNKTGVFTHDTVLCKIDKEIHSSFEGKKVPCVVTTGDGQVTYAALNINRDPSDGKIRITCHGSLGANNVRWIDTEFTIVE